MDPTETPNTIWFNLSIQRGGAEAVLIVSADPDDPEDIEHKLNVLVEQALRRLNGGRNDQPL